MARRKYTPEELHARLIVTIGILLALVFLVQSLPCCTRWYL
jgi:hypothetical protein